MWGVTGRLLLGATPLGQPDDASKRLVEALRTADVVAAEDTRRVRTLARSLDVTIGGRVVSLFDQNEAARVPALLEEIIAGATVLVVSDAGMPLVSDPGYRLVSACASAGLTVSCLPGPSAVTTALAVSGLPSDRFCFEGFPPRKRSARRSWLAGLAVEPRTTVFFDCLSNPCLPTVYVACVTGPVSARSIFGCWEQATVSNPLRGRNGGARRKVG